MAELPASKERATDRRGTKLSRSAVDAVKRGGAPSRGTAVAKAAPLDLEQVKKHLRKSLFPRVAVARKGIMPGKDSEPVLARALEVFGDELKAAHWLASPLGILDGVSPAQALRSKGGREQVEQILTRIEHNIPS